MKKSKIKSYNDITEEEISRMIQNGVMYVDMEFNEFKKRIEKEAKAISNRIMQKANNNTTSISIEDIKRIENRYADYLTKLIVYYTIYTFELFQTKDNIFRLSDVLRSMPFYVINDGISHNPKAPVKVPISIFFPEYIKLDQGKYEWIE